MANQVTDARRPARGPHNPVMNSRPLHANRRPWELAGVGQRRPQAVHVRITAGQLPVAHAVSTRKEATRTSAGDELADHGITEFGQQNEGL